MPVRQTSSTTSSSIVEKTVRINLVNSVAQHIRDARRIGGGSNQKRLNERWILIQREVNAVLNLRIQLFPRIARHSDDPQPGASPGGGQRGREALFLMPGNGCVPVDVAVIAEPSKLAIHLIDDFLQCPTVQVDTPKAGVVLPVESREQNVLAVP